MECAHTALVLCVKSAIDNMRFTVLLTALLQTAVKIAPHIPHRPAYFP